MGYQEEKYFEISPDELAILAENEKKLLLTRLGNDIFVLKKNNYIKEKENSDERDNKYVITNLLRNLPAASQDFDQERNPTKELREKLRAWEKENKETYWNKKSHDFLFDIRIFITTYWPLAKEDPTYYKDLIIGDPDNVAFPEGYCFKKSDMVKYFSTCRRENPEGGVGCLHPLRFTSLTLREKKYLDSKHSISKFRPEDPNFVDDVLGPQRWGRDDINSWDLSLFRDFLSSRASSNISLAFGCVGSLLVGVGFLAFVVSSVIDFPILFILIPSLAEGLLSIYKKNRGGDPVSFLDFFMGFNNMYFASMVLISLFALFSPPFIVFLPVSLLVAVSCCELLGFNSESILEFISISPMRLSASVGFFIGVVPGVVIDSIVKMARNFVGLMVRLFPRNEQNHADDGEDVGLPFIDPAQIQNGLGLNCHNLGFADASADGVFDEKEEKEEKDEKGETNASEYVVSSSFSSAVSSSDRSFSPVG